MNDLEPYLNALEAALENIRTAPHDRANVLMQSATIRYCTATILETVTNNNKETNK